MGALQGSAVSDFNVKPVFITPGLGVLLPKGCLFQFCYKLQNNPPNFPGRVKLMLVASSETPSYK